ncbi:hypothetical protein [Botrimarina mediterranea]|uniref:hypothetical protein n=1 Tax=Botrimarina mediterranea TaxID=2528022 RepID=UPI0011882FBA|nr:hypothetical protein K2D_46680 [Planctomycetes bacterium K2D]
MPKRFFEYRVVWYDREGNTQYAYPETPHHDNHQAMVAVLESKVFAGDATGGHLEELLCFSGVGPQYVVSLGDEEVTQ